MVDSTSFLIFICLFLCTQASPVHPTTHVDVSLQARDSSQTSCNATERAWDWVPDNSTQLELEPNNQPDKNLQLQNCPASRLIRRGSCLSSSGSDYVTLDDGQGGTTEQAIALTNAQIAALDSLGPGARKTWEDAAKSGYTLHRTLETLEDSGVSRLDDRARRVVDSTLKNFYGQRNVQPAENQLYLIAARKLEKLWSQTDYQPINFLKGFSLVNWVATGVRCSAQPIMKVAVYPDVGLQAVHMPSTGGDQNGLSQSLYSSELLWQAFLSATGLKPSVEGARAARVPLKYLILHTIFDVKTRSLMDAAHALYPDRIDHLETGSGVVVGTGSRLKGHGSWRPEDDAFDALLASPDVKTVVNMLADHGVEMDYPTIAKLHTFPVNSNMPDSAYEVPMIFVEFGAGPQPDQGVVATS